ncbi:MAG: DUF4294 domain-containing protein [Bacteroidota bacterium]|nr:DUF4294 domain-containing protein [Bacteroidota bacterium]
MLFFSMFLFLTSLTLAQEIKDGKVSKGIVCKTAVVDGDTIPLIELPASQIDDYVHVMSPIEKWYWDRLVYNVKAVYPYAKLAGIKFREFDAILRSTKSEAEKKKVLKIAEKDLKARFENQLKNLTITQGKILLKLIDRETGNGNYDMIKELRGTFMAFFWQNIGRLFGYNLKARYDPLGDDHQVATVVYMIDNGLI